MTQSPGCQVPERLIGGEARDNGGAHNRDERSEQSSSHHGIVPRMTNGAGKRTGSR